MFNIKSGVVHTPCSKSLQLSNLYGFELYFKKEYLQVTGSFKERGARYALSHLTAAERKIGVIAASAVNLCIGVARRDAFSTLHSSERLGLVTQQKFWGGGLIAGVAAAIKTLKPECHIIGIETETCASFTAAIKEGRPIAVETSSTLADGLAVPTVGGNSLKTAAPMIDQIITVSEEVIALSILRLIEVEKAVVEGAGAVGLAAIISNKVPHLKDKKVVCILTGGNIDTTVLGRSIERGLAVDGRLVRIEVVVSDRPGGIAELTTHIAHSGASIKDIFHERAWISTDVFSVKVKIIAETRDRTHVQELEALLKEKYKNVTIL
ncbi:unnamed protein product, partial [Mesorhabditis spiculigera]